MPSFPNIGPIPSSAFTMAGILASRSTTGHISVCPGHWSSVHDRRAGDRSGGWRTGCFCRAEPLACLCLWRPAGGTGSRGATALDARADRNRSARTRVGATGAALQSLLESGQTIPHEHRVHALYEAALAHGHSVEAEGVSCRRLSYQRDSFMTFEPSTFPGLLIAVGLGSVGVARA
jgi:hypothetical protein